MSEQDLVFYVQLHVKPECVSEWKASLADLIERMAKEEAFISCTLHQDVQDENRYTLYERWHEASVESFIANQVTAKAYRHAYEASLPGWLQTPRTASIVRYVQEWRGRK